MTDTGLCPRQFWRSAGRLILLAFVLVSFAGCGSGSGGGGSEPPPPPDTDLTIRGTVQKGLFPTLAVQAFPVDDSTGELGDPIDAVVSGQEYSVDVPNNQLTLLEASGEFTNDLTGELVTLDEPLLVLVDTSTADVEANINFATTLSAELSLASLESSTLTTEQLIAQSDAFITEAFGMPEGTDPSQLDVLNITETSDMTDPDMQLLVLSAGLMEIVEGDQFFADGFGNFADVLLAATTLEEASGVVSQLNGLSAATIYDLTVQNSGYTLPPNNFSGDFSVLTCIADGTCGWTDPGGPSVSISGQTVWEASGEATVSIRLSEVSTEDVAVTFSIGSGTATASEDFIPVGLGDLPLKIAAGETSIDFDVRIIIDALAESTETIALSLESLSEAYPVLTAQSSLSVKDGAPPGLDGQDAAGIVLQAIRIDGVCNPRRNMDTERDCFAPTGQETSLALVGDRVNVLYNAVDLATDCPDSTNCPQQQQDWKVDFFLVARDSLGTAGEVALGPYIYRQDSVQLVSEPPVERTPFVRFTDAGVLALAADAETNGWDLELEARVGETSQVTANQSVPPPVLVPGTVIVGDSELAINVVRSVSDGASAGCQAGQYALDATYLQPGYGAAAGDILSIFGTLFPIASGVLCVDYDAASTDTTPAVMVAGQLDSFGGTAAADEGAVLLLPEGLYAQIEISGGPSTTGPGLLLLPTLFGQSTTNYLHSEGWPFLFLIDRLSLTPDGIELGYSDMRYVMDVGYSSQDPRSAGLIQSNDIYYSGVAGQSGSLIVGPNGVDGTVNVAGESGPFAQTGFPRARVQWQGFSQAIVNSELQAATLGIDEYRLGQRTSCSGPDCVLGRSDVFVATAAAMPIDGDGYIVGDALNTGTHAEPRWGARGAGAHAWSRPDDLVTQTSIKLASPGYVIPGDAPVADHLLAHLNEPVQRGQAVQKYPLGTDAFADGNYHPPGLSVGPEIYRDATGVPVTGDGRDLGNSGTRLRLDNGVDAAFDLQSSVAVKYVIRNAGITGVFNVESGALRGSAPQFYGYPINLERFAVRTVDNVLDTYTWIDGRLALNGEAGGDAGLDIFFTNLEIDCSAKLGNVDLKYEACDGQDNDGNGIPDENCNPVLAAWKAETDIFAAGFSGGPAGEVCAVRPQAFALQHQMHFEALDKPVAFDTEWDPAGDLVAQTSGELESYRFDRSAEGDGFPFKTGGDDGGVIQLDAAEVDGEDYGWLEMSASQVGVPFWNALESDLRLANQRFGPEISAEPTVVLPAGKLTNTALRNRDLLRDAIAAGENDNTWNIAAEYEWGATGFGFRLPVYYQPWQLDTGRSDEDAEGRQSRFLGRELTKDLFVLDAKAGINFIEPDRTKMSFGASADFTRLEGITFQVDITDPASAAAVDNLLQDLGIIDGPLLEPALTDLLESVDLVNRYANRGLDELMRKGMEEALEEIGKATAPLTPNGQDPFVTASEVLTQIQSMPQQAVALVSGELRAPLNNRLFVLETQVRNQLLAAETEIAALQSGASEQAIQDAFAVVDQLLATLRRIQAEAESIDRRAETIFRDIEKLLSEANAALFELSQVTYDVELAVSQAVSYADAVCSNGLTSVGEGNGVLDQAVTRFAAVRRVVDIIQNTTQWLGAAETIAKNDDAKRALGLAKDRIQEATEELVDFVTAADEAVSKVICNNGQVDQQIDLLTAEVVNWTDRIRGTAFDFIVRITENSEKITAVADLQRQMTDQVLTPLDALISGLEVARTEAADYTGTELVQLIDCVLYNATKPETADECALTSDVPPVVGGSIWINALHAPDGSLAERDIADLIFGTTREEANSVIDTVEEGLVALSTDLVSGAYMTPTEMRRFLVSLVMNSQPVKDLRTQMDTHFAEIGYSINNIVLQVVDHVNLVVSEALASVTGPINDALSEALSVVRGIPLQAAEMNGFATIAGNELERAHLSAGWTMRGSDDNDSTGFKAALDAESWSAKHVEPDANTPAACSADAGGNGSLLDVKISAYGLPINVLAADITIDKLYLGFTLQGNEGQQPALIPVGIFGGINTIGEIGFTDAIVFDPGFAAALGKQQTYIGATAGAVFSSLTADVAFLVGRVCPGNTVLTDLDPDVENFLPSLPASGFTGAYLRGGATIPIIPGGCALNVGVVADFGSWIFVGEPTTLGGLIGGGATGQVACIAALKGKATVGGSVNTNGDLKLRGEAWGVAGVGLDCNPGTWTSVPRSRDDSWCGTGDAQFDVTFDNGKWIFTPPKPSAIH